MFGWEFPPHNNGGLGVACQGMTQALVRDDVEVIFVLPRKFAVSAEKTRFVFADGEEVEWYEFNSPLSPYMTDGIYQREREDATPISGTTLMQEVARYGVAGRRIGTQETFDVIHAHDWLSILAGLEAKRASGKPLVFHIHATEYDRSGGRGHNPEVYEVERRGVHEADCVVAVSQYVKDRIVEDYGVSPDKIAVVHNGVNVEEESYRGLPSVLGDIKERGGKIVLSLGRLTLHKGVDYLVRAAEQVLRFNKDVYFVIAGTGDMERQLIDDVARRGLSDRFIFTGAVRGDERIRLFESADLFVMPSVSEPFGLVPVESILKRTPVLISKQSGVSEVLSHALKVDFWDTDEMANQMLAALEHDALRRELNRQGIRQATAMTWRKAVEKVKKLYTTLTT